MIGTVLSAIASKARLYLAAGVAVAVVILCLALWWQAGRIDALQARSMAAEAKAQQVESAFEQYQRQAKADIEAQAKLRESSMRRAAAARSREEEIRNAYSKDDSACAPVLCDALERVRKDNAAPAR